MADEVAAVEERSDGKLRGEFYVANLAPFSSASSVADGKWHYAVLSTNGTTQKMYLDGATFSFSAFW